MEGGLAEVDLQDRELPREGDAILVFKEKWLAKILNGEKTLEIRGTRLQPKVYWLACNQTVRGSARIGNPVAIESKADWLNMFSQHQWDSEELPYRRTWGLPLSEVFKIRPTQYKRKRGQIGLAKFRAFSNADVEIQRPAREQAPKNLMRETAAQNRAKVLDFAKKGMRQSKVARKLKLSKSRVSQLWPKDPKKVSVPAKRLQGSNA